MAAATITTQLGGKLAEDNVLVTLTSGETYTTKLSSIEGVHVTINEAGTANVYCAVSGREITVTTLPALTDKKMFITVRGRK
jgi:hypothetical protein